MTGSQQPQALLLCMKGHPGTGKSALSRALATLLHIPLVDKDDVRDVFQSYLQQRQPDMLEHALSVPQPDWNSLSYQVMFSVVAQQLSIGLSVLMDCPLSRVELYQTACCIAKQNAAVIMVVECVCSDESVWRQRLEARGTASMGTATNHKPNSWQQVQQLLDGYGGCWKWSTDGSCELQHHVLVDTAKLSTQQAVAAVLEQLTAKGLLPVTTVNQDHAVQLKS